MKNSKGYRIQIDHEYRNFIISPANGKHWNISPLFIDVNIDTDKYYQLVNSIPYTYTIAESKRWINKYWKENKEGK
jgi:hypothetical protein